MAGSGLATLGIPASPGVTTGTAADTIVIPYNDLDEAADAFYPFMALMRFEFQEGIEFLHPVRHVHGNPAHGLALGDIDADRLLHVDIRARLDGVAQDVVVALERGAELVERLLGPRVARLVGAHVVAKRYLITTEPEYRNNLSLRSIETLAAQGDALADGADDADEEVELAVGQIRVPALEVDGSADALFPPPAAAGRLVGYDSAYPPGAILVSASEAAGDGGMGTPMGMTSEIRDRSLRPRAVRKSCTSSAVSLGAGGHLNGVEVTPTTTWPPWKSASTSRRANAPATV